MEARRQRLINPEDLPIITMVKSLRTYLPELGLVDAKNIAEQLKYDLLQYYNRSV